MSDIAYGSDIRLKASEKDEYISHGVSRISLRSNLTVEDNITEVMGTFSPNQKYQEFRECVPIPIDLNQQHYK